MQTNTIENLNKMIGAFKSLHLVNAKAEQTFMQLTDYPHLENVCSNVLAFFFNTEESHNFGSLFVKSLLECTNADANCRSTESIEREVRTDNGNRIDIVIETDRYLIAIENKLYSNVNNPLGDYESHINKLGRKIDKEPIFILLTLREEKTEGSAFVNVTYSKLFSVVKKNMGSYVINANTKWIVMLNDFIRTIEDLQGGTALDREFIEFYNNHKESIASLLDAHKDLAKSMKDKLKSITSLVSFNEAPSDEGYYSSKIDCYAEYYLTYKRVKPIDVPVHWVIGIDTKSCDIAIGIDGATGSQIESLKKLLADRKLNCSRWENNNDYFLVKQFNIFEADEVIAKEFQRLLDVINNAQ